MPQLKVSMNRTSRSRGSVTGSAEVSTRVKGTVYCAEAPIDFSDQVFEVKMFVFVQERL